MRVVICACLVLLCSPVFAAEKGKAGEWHVILNATNECVPADISPAEVIQTHKENGNRHKVIDEKTKNGKPIIVSIENYESGIRIRLFRTKAVCESYLSTKKAKDSVELNRYK